MRILRTAKMAMGIGLMAALLAGCPTEATIVERGPEASTAGGANKGDSTAANPSQDTATTKNTTQVATPGSGVFSDTIHQIDVIGGGIADFEAVPNEGNAPLAVTFVWKKTTPSDSDCEIEIDAMVVAQIKCREEKWSYTFTKPGNYGATLRNRLSDNTDPAQVLVLPSAEAEGNGLWVLIGTTPNWDERPLKRQPYADNANYSGSSKECRPKGDGITYQRKYRYLEQDSYDLTMILAFTPPPPAAMPGESVTISHSLKLSGSATGNPYGFIGGSRITANLIDVPGGKATVSAAAILKGTSSSVEDRDTAEVPFPTSGDRFTISAELRDPENDMGCDVHWLYELRQSNNSP